MKEYCSPINTEELGVPEMVGALLLGGGVAGGSPAKLVGSSPLELKQPAKAAVAASAVSLIAN